MKSEETTLVRSVRGSNGSRTKKKIILIGILILILGWFVFFLAEKADLTTADLGRHLKNGEMVLKGEFDVFKTNFYSYTLPDNKFINHHWLSGVIFYLIYKMAGFTGLSLFYILLSIVTFLIFFYLAKKIVGFKISVMLSLLLIPLIASRTEIRPEIFTYFFAGLFFLILWQHKKGALSNRWLFALPVMGLFWANIHIYFIFGIFIIAVFLLEDLILKNKERIKKLSSILGLTLLASMITPLGPKILLYPFSIFKNYGYMIIENKSIWFLENLDFIKNPNFLFFKAIFLLLIVSFIILLFENRRKFSIIMFCLSVIFGIMSWIAIRNFTIFGFFMLPILAYNIKSILSKKRTNSSDVNSIIILIAGFVFVITVFIYYQYFPSYQNRFGIGLIPENNESAEFFKEKNIQGPILNNYDVGSYLIYHLYPDHQVFVDNRPEAYSLSFFRDIYIPFQESDEKWIELEKQYNFNIIFFSHRDATPWAQEFLIKRAIDPLWAPVFADQYVIIFLKRNTINQDIIQRYEISEDRIRIRSTN